MKELLVGFDSAHALKAALKALQAASIQPTETYTPMPFDEEAGGSPLPLVMFVAGMVGFIGFFVLMAYADVHAYPLDIGGRPKFAWPVFIPIAFELGVLCAMVAGFFGYFAWCRMPTFYDPVDQCESFRGASRDGWFLRIHAGDADRVARARSILEPFQPLSVEEFLA